MYWNLNRQIVKYLLYTKSLDFSSCSGISVARSERDFDGKGSVWLRVAIWFLILKIFLGWVDNNWMASTRLILVDISEITMSVLTLTSIYFRSEFNKESSFVYFDTRISNSNISYLIRCVIMFNIILITFSVATCSIQHFIFYITCWCHILIN